MSASQNYDQLKDLLHEALPGVDLTIVDSTWADLVQRHSEAHRQYHTLSHLQAMFNWLSQAYHPRRIPPTVIMSVLYHDCVYYTRPGARNEAQSADVACAQLQSLGWPLQDISTVRQYIQATEKHVIPAGYENDDDLKHFLDADLSVLASDETSYQCYCKGIREEYCSYSDHDYRQGRLAVLKRLLARDCLYCSTRAEALGMQAAAVNNIQMEIDCLTTQ